MGAKRTIPHSFRENIWSQRLPAAAPPSRSLRRFRQKWVLARLSEGREVFLLRRTHAETKRTTLLPRAVLAHFPAPLLVARLEMGRVRCNEKRRALFAFRVHFWVIMGLLWQGAGTTAAPNAFSVVNNYRSSCFAGPLRASRTLLRRHARNKKRKRIHTSRGRGSKPTLGNFG